MKMLIYDKVILDMSNFFFRVAAFYLKNLNEEECLRLIKSNTLFQNYKENILNLSTQTMGTLYLLFDPLKSNGQLSERQKIKEGYKSTRDKNSPTAKLKADTLEKLYSHFVLEGNKRIVVVHSLEYEADDFTEKLTENGKCLMITSDMDFSRYLEDGRVEMLTSGLSIKEDAIFTFKDFEKKYEFSPSIPSVTFWKALFGDKSDNIEGIFLSDKTKVLRSAAEEAKVQIKRMGEEKGNLQKEKREFFSGKGNFAKLNELLLLSNTKKSYEKLLDMASDNFQIIESLLPRESDIDIEKFFTKVDIEIKNTKKTKFTLNGVKK